MPTIKPITFYGTLDSLIAWKNIVETRLQPVCEDIIVVNGRHRFNTNLSSEDRTILQDEYWYKTFESANGDMPWNYCIAYEVGDLPLPK